MDPKAGRSAQLVPWNAPSGDLPAPYEPWHHAPPPDDEVDLRKLWSVLREYRSTIVTVVLCVLAATGIGTLLTKPIYRASALIEVKPESSERIRFKTLTPALDSVRREYLETQSQILRSRSVAETVIRDVDLRADSALVADPATRSLWSRLSRILASDSGAGSRAVRRAQSEVLDTFMDRLNVTLVHRSNLLEVSFDSLDPDLAAQVANALVDHHVRSSDQRRFNSTSGAKSFLAREIERVQAELESSERELNAFARAENIVDIEDKSNIISSRLGEISSALTETTGQRIAAEALVLQARGGRIEELSVLLENEGIRSLEDRRSKLLADYTKLSEVYKDGYTGMHQLRAEIQQVEASLRAEVSRAAAGLEADLRRLRAKEVLLQAELDGQKGGLLDLRDRGVQYHILKREWEANRELYAALLERWNEVGVAVGMDLDNLAIIDRATPPAFPHRPNLALNLGVALFLGLALATGIAFLRAYLDNTVSTGEELEQLTGFPSLGWIPKLSDEEVAQEGCIELLAHESRTSGIGEALRSIRTGLLYSSASGPPKVVQVTSSIPEEGKTTVSVNLAVVLAQTGSRVLLVDADLRRPRLHKIFGMAPGIGLTEVLLGREDKGVVDSPVENLHVLRAGTPPPNPSELLSSANMDRFLERVSAEFDFVILDTPPVLGLADSLVTGTKVDAVLVVVSADGVRKEGLRETSRRLRSVHAPVVGGVVNMVDTKSPQYSGYGSYSPYGDAEYPPRDPETVPVA